MRGRIQLLTVLVTTGLLAATPVARAESWTEVRSRSFSVVTDGSEKDARRVATQFESIRAYLKTLWPWANVDPQVPVVIFAVRDEGGLKKLLPGAWEERGRARPAGVFRSARDRHWVALRMDVTERRDGDDDWHNPYHVVFHEYVHLVLDLNFRELPAWFNEGLVFRTESDVNGHGVVPCG